MSESEGDLSAASFSDSQSQSQSQLNSWGVLTQSTSVGSAKAGSESEKLRIAVPPP